MEVIRRTGGAPAPVEPTRVASAASFVCRGDETDATRLKAITYLRENPLFSEERIPAFWCQIYKKESSARVVAELEGLLGVLHARGIDSAPLLVFHLHDKRPEVAERALDALFQLSPYMGDAFIPALSVDLPDRRLEQKREMFVTACLREGRPETFAHTAAVGWVREATPRMRNAWLKGVSIETMISDPTEWRRFVALLADPRREKKWSCVKKLWSHEHLLAEHQKRALIACQASLSRDILEEGNPVSTRFYTRMLALGRPYAGSLAHILHQVDLSDFPEAEVQAKVAALHLLPDEPLDESLDKVIAQLWHVSNRAVQVVAIEGLSKVIGDLEERAARKVITQVFTYLRDGDPLLRKRAREISSILSCAQSRDVSFIVDEAERFLTTGGSQPTSEVIMQSLAELQYDSFSGPEQRQVRAILKWVQDHGAPSLCRAAQGALAALDARAAHAAGAR